MPPVTYEANEGMAVLAAWRADAAESVVVFSFCQILFSKALLVIFSSPSFSCLWRRMHQPVTICRNAFPALGVDFQGFHISFAHILVSQLWVATGSFATSKFSTEDVLRYCAILYAAPELVLRNGYENQQTSKGRPIVSLIDFERHHHVIMSLHSESCSNNQYGGQRWRFCIGRWF